jgi:DNA replication protein DnaC
MSKDVKARLLAALKDLRLPTMRRDFEAQARRAAKETWSYEEYLLELVEVEAAERRTNRIERLLRESRIPPEKDLAHFDLSRLPTKVARPYRTLLDGSFVERRENVLMFGGTGSGKTHALGALGRELVRADRSVLMMTCSGLVQELLAAKRDLRLNKELKRLQRIEVLFIDDIGYVQQSREEMEVLFTLLAERYERGSVLLTSNLPFSQWERIFKDPLTTVAAIDRLVHHSVILELNLPSFRMEQAKQAKQQAESGPDPIANKTTEPPTNHGPPDQDAKKSRAKKKRRT